MRHMLQGEHLAALKTATRVLISQVGGLVAAASVCRLEVARLSECQSVNHPGSLLPIDVVLQLEAVAEAPVVTGALARLQGLSVGAADGAAAVDIGRSVATASRNAGAAAATFLEAMADGRMDSHERVALRVHFEALRDAANASLAAL
jgi:hypothetical protein